MNSKPIRSAFCPCDTGIVPAQEPQYEEDIVELKIIKKYVTDSEGHITEKEEQVETSRVNRADYINSFDGETGIQNILRKLGIGVLPLDGLGLDISDKPDVVDIRPLEDVENQADLERLFNKAQVTYANLDPDLKKDMSFEKFCESISGDMLKDYFDKKFNTSKEEGESK